MLNVKLGKLRKKSDHRNLKLSNYLKTAALPALPSSYSWTSRVSSYGMLANDSAGNCTVAAALHLIMLYLADNGVSFVPTPEQAIQVYSAITGYNPKDPTTDTGAAALDVLNWWHKNTMLGHALGAFAEVNIRDINELKYAIYLFGGAYGGMELPLAIQGLASWPTPPVGLPNNWGVGSWGGHCIPFTAFDDATRMVDVVTWGQPLKVSYDFFSDYAEEAYVLLSPDFVNGVKPAPSGFDLACLQQDLNAL